MANIFQDKMVKYLTLGLCLAAIGLLAQSFLAKPKVMPEDVSLVIQALPQVPSIALNPKNLENLKVENLKPFEVVVLPAQVGRANPFEPYPLQEEVSTSTATTTEAGMAATTTKPVATSTVATTTLSAGSGQATTTTKH